MTQHAGLSADRWRSFGKDQQLLMVANEMSRAAGLLGPEDHARLRNSYERVLRLVDLTIEVNPRRALRRELLRWRDVVAELYLAAGMNEERHTAAFRALLLLSPATARQIPFVLRQP
jgi:hypothetical protein